MVTSNKNFDIQAILAKQMADTIRSKASELAVHTLTPIEWGCKYTPQFFFRKGCQFHIDISDALHSMSKERGQKILVMAPRGNAKSTICSQVTPLKAVCEATERYILVISDTADQARGYLKTIADELDHNEEIRAKFPLACEHGDTWNRDRIETGNGVCVEAIGKGGGVRGKKFKQYRPTLVIVDDPQNDEDVMSPTTRAKDLDWFDKALMSVGDTDTNYFVIGTNLHRESIVNVVGKRSDFQTRKYSSITAWPTNMDLWTEWENYFIGGKGEAAKAFYAAHKEKMEEGASVLWPEKETLLQLMQLRASSGHPAFQSEKQNDPRDPNKCEFDEAWFSDDRWYDALPTNPKHTLITIGYCDPATGGQTKRHDYSAIILLHYDTTEGYCYVTVDMKRRSVNDLTDAIVRWCKVYKPHAFGVESNGFQDMVGDEIVAKYPLAPVMGFDNHGIHKNTRISRLSIWFQRGFFRFKRGCRDTMLLMQQVLDHPNSDHDDGPDALEAAVRVLTEVSDLDTPMAEDAVLDDDGFGDNVLDAIGGIY